MKHLVFFVALFSFASLAAQSNLVPNPSFEEYNWIPEAIGDAPGAIRSWTFANEGGSGDYYHARSVGPDYTTKDNYFGSEAPHSGEAYAGFCVTQTYREFLAAPLTEKLVKGKKYKFTMYISKGDHEDVSYLKEISVMFLSRKWSLNNDLVMGLPPQIVFYQDTGFTYHNGWQELTAIYTAQGTEQWIYIGAHQWRCDTCKSVPGTPRTESPWIFGSATMHAHYYVDDVSLTEVAPIPPATDTLAKSITFETGVNYSFNQIHFASNSAVLQENDQLILDSIVGYLLSHPEISVDVTGYTDNIGSEEDNITLSKARAVAVKNYFVSKGITGSRITTEGYGEFHPVGDNRTEEGRRLNRRVDFLFSK